MADDYLSNTQTEGRAEVGGLVAGEIETRHDADWFAVTLEAGQTYRFDLMAAWVHQQHPGQHHLIPYLYGIHDANGNRIWGTWNDDGGSGSNSRVIFTAGADGTYYISAGSYDVSGEWYISHGRTYMQGIYTLSVAELHPPAFDASSYAFNLEAGGTRVSSREDSF